jgi:hypothetical protein
VIDWLTKQISKYQLPVDNNNVIKKSEQDEPVLGRENIRDYIRMMEEFIILMINSNRIHND